MTNDDLVVFKSAWWYRQDMTLDDWSKIWGILNTYQGETERMLEQYKKNGWDTWYCEERLRKVKELIDKYFS